MEYTAELVWKVILVGDTFSGKTTWLLKNTLGKFFDCKMTIGSGFVINENFVHFPNTLITIKTKIIFWDLAGNLRFRSLLPMYSSGSRGAFIFYDDRPPAMKHNTEWIDWIHDNVKEDISSCIGIVGTKMDLKNKPSYFNEDFLKEIDQIVKDRELLGHYLLSSKFNKDDAEAIEYNSENTVGYDRWVNTDSPVRDLVYALLKDNPDELLKAGIRIKNYKKEDLIFKRTFLDNINGLGKGIIEESVFT